MIGDIVNALYSQFGNSVGVVVVMFVTVSVGPVLVLFAMRHFYRALLK